MKKTVFFILFLAVFLALFSADDVEIVLSGNASTDHFAVKDNSSNTLFMVRGNGVVNIPTLSSAPASASEGDLYTNSSTNKIYYYDGTNWIDLTTVTESDPTLTDNQFVTIGDGSSNVIQLTFDGNSTNDGQITWDPTNGLFSIINLGSTTVEVLANGIINFPTQSRCRAYQYNSASGSSQGQVIPNGSWTAVYYENALYDQQGEFTTGTTAGSSYFTASEDGYYQINARCDFILVDGQGNTVTNPNYQGYVSIAIFQRGSGANPSLLLSQGNKLQGADNDYQNWNNMNNNLAPNVSDVLFIPRGTQIEIQVWQNLYNNGLPLRNLEQNGTTEQVSGESQTYVSIHKIS